MEYTVLFFTHSGAIKFKRKLTSQNIICELMPVPRVLSSNCSICAKILFDGKLEELLDNEVEKVFITADNQNQLIYDAD